jgi:hypothetical protein
MSTIRSNIVKAVEKFLDDTGMSGHALGLAAVKDHNFCARLRDPSCNLTIFRVEAVENYIISEHARRAAAGGSQAA